MPDPPPHLPPCPQDSQPPPLPFPSLAVPRRPSHWLNFGPHHHDLATVTGAALQIAAAPHHPVLLHLVLEHRRRLLRRFPPSIELRRPRIGPPLRLHTVPPSIIVAGSSPASPSTSVPPTDSPCRRARSGVDEEDGEEEREGEARRWRPASAVDATRRDAGDRVCGERLTCGSHILVGPRRPAWLATWA